MTDPQDKTLEINLSTLRVLLFGDERLECVRPSSAGIGDTAKILVMPVELGRAISIVDKDENFFHVVFLPSHAEVWLAFEWKESNAKLLRQREFSAAERTAYDKNKRKLEVVSSQLKSFGFRQPGFAEHLAKEILQNWKSGEYSEMLKTLNLTEKLKELDQE